MAFEEINETIEVIAHFDGKRIRPLRFRWAGRVYKITQLISVWDKPKGRAKEYHFRVLTRESNSFELLYDNDSFKWKIGRSFTY